MRLVVVAAVPGAEHPTAEPVVRVGGNEAGLVVRSVACSVNGRAGIAVAVSRGRSAGPAATVVVVVVFAVLVSVSVVVAVGQSIVPRRLPLSAGISAVEVVAAWGRP